MASPRSLPCNGLRMEPRRLELLPPAAMQVLFVARMDLSETLPATLPLVLRPKQPRQKHEHVHALGKPSPSMRGSSVWSSCNVLVEVNNTHLYVVAEQLAVVLFNGSGELTK